MLGMFLFCCPEMKKMKNTVKGTIKKSVHNLIFWISFQMPKEVLYMYTWACIFNPLTPISDQERISPYNIKTISSRQVMRIRKISVRGL